MTTPTNASIATQISFFLEDKIGTLAAATKLLGDNQINIWAMTLTGGIDHCFIRMVVDKTEAAIKCLRDNGYLVFAREVVLAKIANSPGALAKLADRWAAAGINIEYVYCAAEQTTKEGIVVLRVDNPQKAIAVITE